MDLQSPQEFTEMQWLRKNFWITIAVTIIIVSVGLGLLLFCICSWLLRRGKKLEITKNLKLKRRDEEMMYENVVNELPAQLPPLPPRRLFSPKDASPQETPEQSTYSWVNKAGHKKTVSIPSYIEPEEDYDDVEISANMANHHSETAVSSFWRAEEGSHNFF
ncbi:SLP adapter and CSK-interacting membrane protein [Galemys pyrenaicus]|uniref:SLP adapter and CSK-interacting membrane protein n=1 Tax=Galemys pyrenaicus TaxID=202257 RepID=A0A8J6ADV3_GALPY|nr:SLP adapter and CSK-interacting membrane protein [Galemys pyrenaicus]